MVLEKIDRMQNFKCLKIVISGFRKKHSQKRKTLVLENIDSSQNFKCLKIPISGFRKTHSQKIQKRYYKKLTTSKILNVYKFNYRIPKKTFSKQKIGVRKY